MVKILYHFCTTENCPENCFPFFNKSHEKRNRRTKWPLHVFFIWCRKSTKSTLCKKESLGCKLWEDLKKKKKKINDNSLTGYETGRCTARVLLYYSYPPEKAQHLCTQWS